MNKSHFQDSLVLMLLAAACDELRPGGRDGTGAYPPAGKLDKLVQTIRPQANGVQAEARRRASVDISPLAILLAATLAELEDPNRQHGAIEQDAG